jgi:hypothetical protein
MSKERGMRKTLVGWSAVLVFVIAGAVASVGSAAATEPETIACDANALAHAFDVGGTYVFGADCELMLGAELTLHTATTLTLESGDHHVAFIGTNAGSPFWPPASKRFATVDGHLTLEGIVVKRFSAGGTSLDGTPGTPGTNGLDNTCPICPEAGNGTERASNGTGGGHGGDGRDSRGGALLIEGGGVVTLEVTQFTEDYADGGRGGAGGNGGNGGVTVDRNFANENDTEPGGDGADGGEGGRGGDAYGGAIENDGTLIVNLSQFDDDIALGGTSVGGTGGEGGLADGEGIGGKGGNGGAAGSMGSAFGGAIYNTGSLTVTNTEFISDYAGYTGVSFSGAGGWGGSSNVQGGPGGNGGAPGSVGLVSGGDVYSVGAFTVTGGRANGVTDAGIAEGGGGGRGGAGCGAENGSAYPSCQFNGINGSPDPAGAPPSVHGQTGGETFVPTPNSGPGGGEAPGGETTPGGGETGGNGSTGNGSGDTGGPGTVGSGSGAGSGSGSGTGGSGGGSNSGGSGTGGAGGGGHAILGKITDSGTTTSVPVECPASGPSCAITAELTASGGGAGDATGSPRRLLEETVLGRAKVTVRPGHSTSLKVGLGAGGRRRLADRRRLAAHLTVLQKIGGKQTVLRSATVTFKAHG